MELIPMKKQVVEIFIEPLGEDRFITIMHELEILKIMRLRHILI